MRISYLLHALIIALSFFIFNNASAQTHPLSLNTENPHYFLYKGKPTILISSGEHYGAVLNLDFDYEMYLDELKSNGLNLTRTFSGAYAEPMGAFNIAKNTLAPAEGKFICPWKRSEQPGYTNGGNKFDLTQWDENYFKRLKNFVSAAQQRGVIVEFTLFCPFYEEAQWKLSPMNAINNINNIGNVDRNNVYTLDKNDGLLAIHDAMVRKIVNELKDFDNVMYEICNEPYFGGVTKEWQEHIAGVITATEKNFPAKHLITQNIANNFEKISDANPAVSVFNFHYASPPVTVTLNYNLNKVIGDNETGFRGTSDSTYRREGWEFILAGGGLYNNLDYSFTPDNEKGDFAVPSTQPGGGSAALRKQLSYLKSFINQFDFVHMQPDSMSVYDVSSKQARVHVLSEKGKQYAVYIFGGNQINLALTIPAGTYKTEWMNTLTGKIEKQETLQHKGGKQIITSPDYKEDIALRIMNIVK
jgi:hypothetical protein